MNSSLTSSLSEFSIGRPDKPLRRSTVRNLITAARLWLGKLVSFAVVRVLLIFFVGFTAGIAWQSYGGVGRKAIAAWSPHLVWLAPAADGTSADRFKAMSLALVAARQSLDKLSTEISKLPVQDGDAPRRRATR